MRATKTHFHTFVNMRRKTNTIWEIVHQDGCRVSTQSDLEKVARAHFEKLYTKPFINNLTPQLEVLQSMPCIFTDEDNYLIGTPVTLAEVADILKKMAKDKSPGLAEVADILKKMAKDKSSWA